MLSGDPLEQLLRDGVASGDWAPLGEHLAPGALLDSNSPRGRARVEGAAAIVAHLSEPGPGEVVDWEAREWPSGVALSFEWRGGAGGGDRRRWYLRRDEAGLVTGIWSYAAQPRDAGGETGVPKAVLAAAGPGARREPLAHAGNSGAALERIILADGRALVAKRLDPGADWLARATGDKGRTALLWQAGAFARMPESIDHGIVDVHRDGGAWWVLMRDLGATLLGDERRLSRDESRRILAAAADLHGAFAGETPDGAASLAARIGFTGFPIAEAERGGSDLLPKQFEPAWDAFAEAVPDDVVAPVLRAVEDPQPLADALTAAGPVTLIHGDLRDDNLGFDGDRIVLLDWDLAAVGTPTVDFAWYLCHDTWRIDATHDELEADFRAAEPELNEREVDLGLLSGLVQYGWIFGHSARVHPDPAERAWAEEELAWWVPRVRLALERTGEV